MKKGEKKKQQKALARRTERKAAQRSRHATSQVNPDERVLRQARSYPLIGCWTLREWTTSGITPVIVARRQPDGLVAFASFLVDYYCLGLKDVLYKADVSYARFMDEFLPHLTREDRPQEIPADMAHELIYGSIEYAARWGFRPHRDFNTAQFLLDPPEDHPISGKIEFGKDGKPLYISGPHDNVDAIIRQLLRTAGEGNFDYIAHIGPPPSDFFEDDEEEWEEEEEE